MNGRCRLAGFGDGIFQIAQTGLIPNQSLSPGLIEFPQRVILGCHVGLQDIQNLAGGTGIGR